MTIAAASAASAGEMPTPLPPATITWGGISDNDPFATPETQTGLTCTARAHPAAPGAVRHAWAHAPRSSLSNDADLGTAGR